VEPLEKHELSEYLAEAGERGWLLGPLLEIMYKEPAAYAGNPRCTSPRGIEAARFARSRSRCQGAYVRRAGLSSSQVVFASMKVAPTTARLTDVAGGGLAKMLEVDPKQSNVFPFLGHSH
jgi:hypothetical protein